MEPKEEEEGRHEEGHGPAAHQYTGRSPTALRHGPLKPDPAFSGVFLMGRGAGVRRVMKPEHSRLSYQQPR